MAEGNAPKTTDEAAEAAHNDCRRALQHIIHQSYKRAKNLEQQNLARRHCMKEEDADRAAIAWHEAWIESGLAEPTTRVQKMLPPDPNHASAPPTPQKAQPPPTPLPDATRVVYTDGSGPDDPARGAAGWGFTIVTGGDGIDDKHATEQHAASGKVETEPTATGHIGATKGTNNTGELSAIAAALEHILTEAPSRPALLRYDSLYAGMMAAGKWRPRANKALVLHVRRLWDRAHEHLGGALWVAHVRAHSGHKWNDRADELAKHGKGGAPRTRKGQG